MRVLFLSAFAVVLGASQVGGAQPISATTSGDSIAAPDILRLLISDYDERMRRWEATKGSDDEMWDRFDIRMSERLETDFGLGGKRYLVVSLEGDTGACTQCYLLVIGVLDPDSKEVVWRFGDEGIGGPARILLRRVFSSPEGLSLSYQHLEGSTNWGFVRTETWIQPTSDAFGHLSFREIWSNIIEASNAGNHGGGAEWSCGWMVSGDQRGGFSFHQSTFYADGSPCGKDQNPDQNPDWGQLSCARRIRDYRDCSTTEIERSESWITKGKDFKRTSFRSRRIDHAESEVFPFDLPVRSTFYRRKADSVPVFVYPKERRLLKSPDRESLLEFENSSHGPEVSLVRKGRHRRTVRLRQGDLFDGAAESLGWASDSRRFFVIVRFGFAKDRALLSFSAQGEDDYWEGLLSDDPAEWKDGFVLEPAKPVVKKGEKHKR